VARFVVLLAALGLLVVAGVPALGTGTETPRVKYYLVAATADGSAETLTQIAVRLLDDASRAEELYELNEGRRQPDGGALTRGQPLHVGWVLVLPWDAIGDGVRYGSLPETTPGPTGPTSAPTSPGAPTSSPTTSPEDPTAPPPGTDGQCPTPPVAAPASSAWAQEQLAAPEAWAQAGRGSGVVVAVVDSGVDASVPQLSGRVSAGVDVVTGAGSGNVDCLGTGTGMAALIVAEDPEGMLGLAPDATVVPVRVAVDQHAPAATDQATAIDVAISTGARVIALGTYLDLSLPGVRQSINNAASHDVVVVAAGPLPDDGSLPRQLVRVGVLNADGRPAQDYAPGTVDVLAPGQDVTTLGVGGQGPVQVSGVQYAVALVAGAAALVRGAAPELAAEQVVDRLRTTATPLADPGSAGQGGSDGVAVLVNLAGAVGVTPTEVGHRATAPAPRDSGTTLLITAAVLVVLSAVGGFLLLRRRGAPRSAETIELEPIGTSDGPPSR